jgi:hypothetical protein
MTRARKNKVGILTTRNGFLGSLLVPLLFSCLLFSSASLFAQDSAGGSDWEYSLDAYLWGASINSKSPRGGDSTIDFDVLWKNLELAFMGGFTARNDRWSVGIDAVYMDAKKTTSKPIGIGGGLDLTRGGSLQITSWIVTPTVGYVLHDSDKGRFEVLGGLRYLDLDGVLKADVSTPSQPLVQFRKAQSGSNWDAIVGLRGQVNLNSSWFMPLYVDVGAGDSKSTWQGLAGLGYRFSKVNVLAAYRYLDYNFDDQPGSLMSEMTIEGPLMAFSFQF